MSESSKMKSLLYVAAVLGVILDICDSSRLPLEVFTHRPDKLLHLHHSHHVPQQQHRQHIESDDFRVLYQVGSSEKELPLCRPKAVCSKVDLYEAPWLERQCRCPGTPCPSSLHADDGHTIADKTRHYKLCEPVKRLPKCRYFRDATWTLISVPDANSTEQIVHCHCPKNSVTYLIKRQAYQTPSGQLGYQFAFACSPQSRLRCQRKEPCRLFTVRKRQEFLDEVNTSTLCNCPREHHCPRHHTDPGVIPGKSYTEEAIRTYSGYCMPT